MAAAVRERFNPGQPRDPGGEGGGQWVRSGGVKRSEIVATLRAMNVGARREVAPGVIVSKVGQGTAKDTGVVYTVRGNGQTIEAPDLDEAVGHVLNISATRRRTGGKVREASD